MKEYLEVLERVYWDGQDVDDRTGTGTRSLFSVSSRYNLKEGFPLVTTKKMFTRGVVAELLWFISGSVKVQDLRDAGVNFWDSWEGDDGTIGPGYGKQFRNIDGRDPLQELIDGLKSNPHSRRHVMTLWNFKDIPNMTLPCCHGTVIQFYIKNGELSCHMHQRSGDMFLGVPVNIASYSLLTHMIAKILGLGVGEFIHTIGDAHIYVNHLDQVATQLQRKPLSRCKVVFNEEKTYNFIDDFAFEDISFEDYVHHDPLKGEVAV